MDDFEIVLEPAEEMTEEAPLLVLDKKKKSKKKKKPVLASFSTLAENNLYVVSDDEVAPPPLALDTKKKKKKKKKLGGEGTESSSHKQEDESDPSTEQANTKEGTKAEDQSIPEKFGVLMDVPVQTASNDDVPPSLELDRKKKKKKKKKKPVDSVASAFSALAEINELEGDGTGDYSEDFIPSAVTTGFAAIGLNEDASGDGGEVDDASAVEWRSVQKARADDAELDAASKKGKQKKKKKKKKKNTTAEDDIDQIISSLDITKTTAMKDTASVEKETEEATDRGDDIDDILNSLKEKTDASVAPPSKKASKKKKKRKNTAVEDDIDQIISSLDTVTTTAKKDASPVEKEAKEAADKCDDIDDILNALKESTGGSVAPSSKKTSKKKKKKKKSTTLSAEAEDNTPAGQADLPSALSVESKPVVTGSRPRDVVVAAQTGLEISGTQAESAAGGKVLQSNSDVLPAGDGDEEDLLASLGLDISAPTARSAAPKKKSKKKSKKPKADSATDGATKEESSATAEKKKPKKKESATVRRLRELREEQERARKLQEEEEARVRAEEEALKQAEREKEEARKREKEAKRLRKERLRAEGKLLTKAQRERKRKNEAVLQQLKSQGFVIGASQDTTSAPKKRVVYSSKKKKRSVKGASERETTDGAEMKGLLAETPKEQDTEEKERPQIKVEDDRLEEWDAGEAWDAEEALDAKDKSLEASDSDSKPVDSTSDSEESESKAQRSSEDSSGDDDDEEFEGMSKAEIAAEKRKETIRATRECAAEEAYKSRSPDRLRSPIICIMGHVDTGKTKILDKIRRTNVQDAEAGGITQQIGATFFPIDAVIKEARKLADARDLTFQLPALLIIDTPGHESFTNLRSRGSSLCDLAILVVDIMHGLEPQTMESIDLLKIRKTPFIVALNKIDRMYGWKEQSDNCPVRQALAAQPRYVQEEFDRRVQETQVAFAEIGFNAEIYWKNENIRKNISLVPTSAITGEGMPDLLTLLVSLSQKLLMERLMFSPVLECTILEVKVIEGHGTTIDVILTGGKLRAGDTIAVVGLDGPIITTIRALLTPHAMKEMRVKGQFLKFDEIEAAQGVKIAADGLEKAVAGTQLLVAEEPDNEDEIEFLKEEVMKDVESILQDVDKSGMGVYVQASTLGSLEALLDFLRASKIPVSGINIGPVHKKDVTKASTMLEKQREYATILAFDVPVEREAREIAEETGVQIFTADIIYHLFDQFTAYMEEVRKRRKEEINNEVVFPSILEVIPTFVFNKKDPILLGVEVKEGILRIGTPLVIRKDSGEWLDIGRVTSIELNKKPVTLANRKQNVAIKIEGKNTENIMYGRHFDHTDPLVSKMSRRAIDILKDNFRDELEKDDWKLVVKLKAMLNIE